MGAVAAAGRVAGGAAARPATRPAAAPASHAAPLQSHSRYTAVSQQYIVNCVLRSVNRLQIANSDPQIRGELRMRSSNSQFFNKLGGFASGWY